MWKTEAEDVLRKFPQKLTSDIFITTAVEKAIRDSLGTEYFMYIKKKADSSNILDGNGFIVKQKHVNGGTKAAPHTLRDLKELTEQIMEETSGHYSKAEKGGQFEPKHAETLFKDIQSQIDQIKDSGIETTLHYRVEFMQYVEELAVRNFCLNQKAYEQHMCPRKLLQKKRDAYHQIFLIATGIDDPAVGFSRILLKLIQENLEDRMTCTELMNILRNHQGDIFKSAKRLECHLFKARWSRSGEMTHRLSIAKYEEMIKETITENSVSCFEDEDRLKTYANSVLDTIMSELNDAFEKTAHSQCKSKDFIRTLFSNMNGLKKPHNDIAAYNILQVEDKSKFTSTQGRNPGCSCSCLRAVPYRDYPRQNKYIN